MQRKVCASKHLLSLLHTLSFHLLCVSLNYEVCSITDYRDSSQHRYVRDRMGFEDIESDEGPPCLRDSSTKGGKVYRLISY